MPPAEVVPFAPPGHRAATTLAFSPRARFAAEERTAVDYERLFLDNLDLIDAVVTQVCRHGNASEDEEDAFRSSVRLVLIENDFAVLRAFTGESSLRGFLVAVLQNAFLQHRAGAWEKWRPSKEAQQLGDVGVLLERLTHRDRHTFDEAVEILWTDNRLQHSRDELWAMYLRFPARGDRRLSGDRAVQVRDQGVSPEEALFGAERASKRAHACAVLARVMRELTPRERLILKLQYVEQMQQAGIARGLGEEPKTFYRQCSQLLKRVRRRLEQEGVEPLELGF